MQYRKQDGRENDVSILLALALLDPDEHPVTIDIGELERYDLRGSQAGGISQAQDRPVLDVRRCGEQPTDLLRAQNNGQAARLAGRDELLGKIVAFQCDFEEEPQCSGADVGGSRRRPDRGQPQLIAMDILDGGLVGHWGLLSWVRSSAPRSQDRTPASATPRDPSLAAYYRGSGLVLRRILLVAAVTGEGPLIEPRAAAQAWPREMVSIPFWRLLPLYSIISPARGSGRPTRTRGAPNDHTV